MQSIPHALICGIGGQDGAYLAEYLIGKGYQVTGTSRDANSTSWSKLDALGIRRSCELVSMSLNDFRSVLRVITKCKPTEIYNLAGQTSVGLSFEQPVEAIESISIGTLNLLEAVRFVDFPVRLYNAGSSECFGDTQGLPASEKTEFKPRSPYAVAKACAHNLVLNYRDAYGLKVCTGILFNHESPLRPDRFVTQKIVKSVSAIAQGKLSEIRVGNIEIQRDWGWAPEYVEAMWKMLQLESPRDFVIATGRTVSLKYFIERAFANFKLVPDHYLVIDNSLIRPSEILTSMADPTAAAQELGWIAKHNVDDVVDMMCAAESHRLPTNWLPGTI